MRKNSLAALLFVGAAACGGLPDTALVVEKVNVSGVDGDQLFSESLEIEVHVYARTETGREYLGCAGESTGLKKVDEPNYTYYPDAHFIRPFGEEILTLADLTDEVFFMVTEDDEGECPLEQTADGPDFGGNIQQQSNQDDLAGISDDVAKMDLAGGRWAMSFPGAQLTIALAGAPSPR